MAPIIQKAISQPHWSAIHGTVSGANMAPTLVPELNMPVANERSFFGKYSAVALIAAGKFPDSPKPNTARAIIKPSTETEIVEKPSNAATGKKTDPIDSAYA